MQWRPKQNPLETKVFAKDGTSKFVLMTLDNMGWNGVRGSIRNIMCQVNAIDRGRLLGIGERRVYS